MVGKASTKDSIWKVESKPMHMDLVQLFRDFSKLTDTATDVGEAETLINEAFQIDRAEVKDLHDVFHAILCEKFKLDKLSKKQAQQLDDTIEVMYDSFFFGMYVAKGFHW